MLLKQSYYLNEDVVFLAKDLLGKKLLTELNGITTSGIIVETEAYKAPEDRASHAYNNRLTNRTKTMFMKGGHAYVYLCYGVHEMFNVVTANSGIAHAILIRAIEPIEGIETMMHRKNMNSMQPAITKGPGSLCKAMGINRLYNETKLFSSESAIRIYDDKIRYSNSEIGVSARIGVQNSGESATWPFRFFIKGNPYVSRFKP